MEMSGLQHSRRRKPIKRPRSGRLSDEPSRTSTTRKEVQDVVGEERDMNTRRLIGWGRPQKEKKKKTKSHRLIEKAESGYSTKKSK